MAGMRGVTDTNTVVSGLLWHGPPRQVLEAARSGALTLYTTAVLLAELEDVLNRPRFAPRIGAAGFTPHDLVLGYAALATLVEPAPIEPVIVDDPDDDAVLACAVAAHAEVIASGDSHLLRLGEHQGIRIVTAPELLALLAPPPQAP
jgi:putative PIN family toxin of toxin-antitoxin system